MKNQSNGIILKLILVVVAIIGTLLMGLSLLNRNVQLNAQDVSWSYCDNNIYPGKKIFCRFQLDPNKTYSGQSGGYKVSFENSKQFSTCWLEEKALVCNDIPTDDLKEGNNNKVIVQLNKNETITKNIEISKLLNKGVNVARWFRYGEKTNSNYQDYMNSQDIQNIKDLGFDHIRLPIDVEVFYTNSSMFDYLGLAIKKITDQGLVVIVDGHSENLNSTLESNPSARQKYKIFWTQLAERLKGFDAKKVNIQPYNEPVFEKNNKLWSQFQLELYQVIRKVLPDNTIILTANNKSYFNSFAEIELPKDSNIMLDIHYYSEFVYSHQGAEFSSDFLKSVKGLAYPYNKLNCTSVLNSLTDKESIEKVQEYCNTQTNYDKQKILIEKNIKPLQDKGYKVIIGEYGAFSCQKNITPATQKIIKDSKLKYLRDVSKIFEELKIPNTLWGFDDCFGLEAKKVDGAFEYDNDYLDAVLGR
jgi:endoglucanase